MVNNTVCSVRNVLPFESQELPTVSETLMATTVRHRNNSLKQGQNPVPTHKKFMSCNVTKYSATANNNYKILEES